MTAKNFKKWDIILGWLTFAIALITYSLTIEPTVSAWDVGEYISTAVKLEVGHPPGAPLFQMLGAFFAMFTSDVSEIAKMVNFMSALASAFTILFMFWTISNLGQKLAIKSGGIVEGSYIAILGSSVVGSLAYTFSDSFWFSAVEGEVYAMSSFLMAILFWLGLKWESEIHLPRGNKWLILISFVVGLSFGVHILSLLVIPAIVMLYFFKTCKNINLKTTAVASVISVLILVLVFKFIFPFTLKFFSASELFFVNSIGLPFNSGSIIAGIILIALFYFGLSFTRKKNKITANNLVLSLLFMMIGFSSWMMLPIRANANTTINENNPSSARELLAYYEREQYGDANVFYDTYYSNTYSREQDRNNPTRDDKPKYEKKVVNGKDKYVIVNNYKDVLPNWSDKHKGFIPRMVDPSKEKMYKAIAGIPENSKRRPTFAENIKFMISYQFGYMYGRYFMWNFVGRQNDIQGNLDIFNGNWLSGIDFIDEARLGSQQKLPPQVLENKGRNTYYFLPLILGIIGLLFQIKWDKENFYTLFLFFLFTGAAIIFYTNPKPFEPRERDYAVVGSFYIFAIWIGFGVFALFDYLKSFVNKRALAIAVSVVSLLAVPTLMASENWDDHDRSNRYTTFLNAQAYLESCDPNAIMFTIGDNDTFPLWYMQEVEGIRTDIKLVNTSLFQTDWYIDQMKRATYKAAPIPSELTHDEYKYGTLDVAYYFQELFPQLKDSVLDIDSYMKWIRSDSKRTFYDLDDDGNPEKILPTNKIRIPVNKENVLKYGIVAQKDADKIVPYIDITIDRAIGKNTILMLDILNNFDWKRPIYFTGGSNSDSEYIWLKDYLQLDGVAFKLVPIQTPTKIYNQEGQLTRELSLFDIGRIDPEKMYNNIKKWEWRNINDGKIYLDEQTKRNAISMRNSLMRLSTAFAKEGDTLKAIEVLDLSLEKLPIKDFDHFSLSLEYPEFYYKLGEQEKARAAAKTLIKLFKDKLLWFSTFDSESFDMVFEEFDLTFRYLYRGVIDQVENFDTDQEYVKELQKDFNETLDLFKHIIPSE
ncbi:glycosyltransferase family 117 protein [Polaribacter marinivivus]|uniref:glycosyltransferase family 117 protein n=1 Tax=Polaribacter marinivivus TaxID=1524260 RepID=UPI003D34597F